MVAASADTPGQGLSGRSSNLFPFASGMAVLIVGFSLAFLPSIRWIFEEWSGSSGVLSHGYLVAAISIYLFIRAIPEAAAEPARPMWSAFPVLLGLSFVWLLGHCATVIAVETIVLPAILLTAIALVFGLSVARKFAFPVLFIYFAIPAVEHLQFIFQGITVVAVHAMIRVADIAAYVQGNLVFIPEGTFAIESGCSGLNFVVSGLSLAVLYGHLYYDNVWRTLRLAILVLAVSMFGNWIRVFIIVNIGYFLGMDNNLVVDHLWLGWVIFAVLMVPVFMVARRLESGTLAKDAKPANRNTTTVAAGRGSFAAISAALVALVTGPSWAMVTAPTQYEEQNVSILLPEDVRGWRGPLPTIWDWQPKYVGATAERIAEFEQDSTTILVYANVYLSQEQGRELIYFGNSVRGVWRRSSATREAGQLDVQNAGWFQQTVVDSPYGQWVILHRNVIGGEPVMGNIRSKIRQSIATLQGKPDAGVIAFAISCADSCDEAVGTLADFIAIVGEDATVKFEIEGK